MKMETGVTKPIGHRTVLIVVLLVFLSRDASTQDEPNLGIFDVSFEIVLSNQIIQEAITTDAITTDAIATTKATAQPATSSESPPMTSSPPSVPDAVTSAALALAAGSDSTTDPVTSTTTLTTTTTSPPVTQSEDTLKEIVRELSQLLPNEFAATTAYIITTEPVISANTGILLRYGYNVIYDKTQLNAASMLYENSEFIEELRNVTEVISAWQHNFTEQGFTVYEEETRSAMLAAIETLNQQFANVTWRCTGSECSSYGATCRQNGTANNLICGDKCEAFEAGNSCTEEPSVYGVYVQGTCALDEYGNPYCNCGKSPGDVLSNFYDGEQCVSVTFIVAMAASAGGLFFILWLITLCVVCNTNQRKKRNASSRKSSSSDSAPHYNGYHEAYHQGMELGHRPYDKEYVSYESPKSSHSNDAYEVPREDEEEFKSVRL